eukprot:scaffold2394_cov276-Pinguiococcus_pyrenoidosus.AAC.11
MVSFLRGDPQRRPLLVVGRVNGCAVLRRQQQSHDIHVTLLRRQEKRRPSQAVARLRLGAAGEQELHHRKLAMPCHVVKGRVAPAAARSVLRLDVCSHPQEILHDLRPECADGSRQRSSALVVIRFDIGADLDEPLDITKLSQEGCDSAHVCAKTDQEIHDLRSAVPSGVVKRSLSVRVPCLQVSAMLYQELNGVLVSFLARHEEDRLFFRRAFAPFDAGAKATQRGVRPPSSSASTAACLSSSRETTDSWPCSQARWRAVLPSFLFALTSAPLRSRIETTSPWPFSTARCKGVEPSCRFLPTPASRSSSSAATSQ